eukprot:GHVN01035499.1.p1 GENE.GHVN01035499.1~~GHVN01035499.1.p1  ORF type:complete len:1531 (+),score=366.57 GHVN01035499.1:1031-5623(+)
MTIKRVFDSSDEVHKVTGLDAHPEAKLSIRMTLVQNQEDPEVAGRRALIEQTAPQSPAHLLRNYKIKMLAGRNLSNRKKRGLVNPFVSFFWNGKECQSSKKHRTGRPKWGDEFMLLVDPDNSEQHEIDFRVCDDDKQAKFDLGSCLLNLTHIADAGEELWLPLQGEDSAGGEICVAIQPLDFVELDDIHKGVQFPTPRVGVSEEPGVVVLDVVEGRDLAIMNSFGKSDPYVSFQWRGRQMRTCVATHRYTEGSLSPQWGDTFKFRHEPTVDTRFLDIYLYDRDPAAEKDKIMGNAVVDLRKITQAPHQYAEWIRVEGTKAGTVLIRGTKIPEYLEPEKEAEMEPCTLRVRLIGASNLPPPPSSTATLTQISVVWRGEERVTQASKTSISGECDWGETLDLPFDHQDLKEVELTVSRLTPSTNNTERLGVAVIDLTKDVRDESHPAVEQWLNLHGQQGLVGVIVQRTENSKIRHYLDSGCNSTLTHHNRVDTSTLLPAPAHPFADRPSLLASANDRNRLNDAQRTISQMIRDVQSSMRSTSGREWTRPKVNVLPPPAIASSDPDYAMEHLLDNPPQKGKGDADRGGDVSDERTDRALLPPPHASAADESSIGQGSDSESLSMQTVSEFFNNETLSAPISHSDRSDDPHSDSKAALMAKFRTLQKDSRDDTHIHSNQPVDNAATQTTPLMTTYTRIHTPINTTTKPTSPELSKHSLRTMVPTGMGSGSSLFPPQESLSTKHSSIPTVGGGCPILSQPTTTMLTVPSAVNSGPFTSVGGSGSPYLFHGTPDFGGANSPGARVYPWTGMPGIFQQLQDIGGAVTPGVIYKTSPDVFFNGPPRKLSPSFLLKSSPSQAVTSTQHHTSPHSLTSPHSFISANSQGAPHQPDRYPHYLRGTTFGRSVTAGSSDKRQTDKSGEAGDSTALYQPSASFDRQGSEFFFAKRGQPTDSFHPTPDQAPPDYWSQPNKGQSQVFRTPIRPRLKMITNTPHSHRATNSLRQSRTRGYPYSTRTDAYITQTQAPRVKRISPTRDTAKPLPHPSDAHKTAAPQSVVQETRMDIAMAHNNSLSPPSKQRYALESTNTSVPSPDSSLRFPLSAGSLHSSLDSPISVSSVDGAPVYRTGSIPPMIHTPQPHAAVVGGYSQGQLATRFLKAAHAPPPHSHHETRAQLTSSVLELKMPSSIKSLVRWGPHTTIPLAFSPQRKGSVPPIKMESSASPTSPSLNSPLYRSSHGTTSVTAATTTDSVSSSCLAAAVQRPHRSASPQPHLRTSSSGLPAVPLPFAPNNSPHTHDTHKRYGEHLTDPTRNGAVGKLNESDRRYVTSISSLGVANPPTHPTHCRYSLNPKISRNGPSSPRIQQTHSSSSQGLPDKHAPPPNSVSNCIVPYRSTASNSKLTIHPQLTHPQLAQSHHIRTTPYQHQTPILPLIGGRDPNSPLSPTSTTVTSPTTAGSLTPAKGVHSLTPTSLISPPHLHGITLKGAPPLHSIDGPASHLNCPCCSAKLNARIQVTNATVTLEPVKEGSVDLIQFYPIMR